MGKILQTFVAFSEYMNFNPKYDNRFCANSTVSKVEKIFKCSLDSIPSPLPSKKIQIMGGNVCLRCKGKTLLGVVNKPLETKSLLTSPCNVLPY